MRRYILRELQSRAGALFSGYFHGRKWTLMNAKVINDYPSEFVVPAKAGTHASELCSLWIPACAGMTV